MTTPAPTKQPDEKQFSLKQIELQMIGNMGQRHNAALVDFLSFIALDRLAYQVTPNTVFRVDDEGKLYISEKEAAPEKNEEVDVA